MKVIRPIKKDDLPYLEKFAQTAGMGVTSLPRHPTKLEKKLEKSLSSFAESEEYAEGLYLFVLEDLETGMLGGTCAINAMTRGSQKGYYYRVEELVLPKSSLNTRQATKILHPIQKKSYASEVGGLYLLPKYRQGGLGRLLSLSRFLFMAAFPQRFKNKVIAEMRGRMGTNNHSPFWAAVGKNFLNISYSKLLVELANDRSFIPAVVPQFPIYISLLPRTAQLAIGKTHKNTRAALRLLENEGFQETGEVDIFDAGPTLAALTSRVRTINESKQAKIRDLITAPLTNEQTMLSNDQVDFRAAWGEIHIHDDGTVTLPKEVAHALQLQAGDTIRYVNKHSKVDSS